MISSALKARRELGPGFLESIYHASLLIQLRRDGMKADTEKKISVTYTGVEVGMHRLNLVVDDAVVIELKAVKGFEDAHLAQVLSYLKASGIKTGLLLNFGGPTLKIKRVVL
jgi:GxxExxY protein